MESLLDSFRFWRFKRLGKRIGKRKFHGKNTAKLERRRNALMVKMIKYEMKLYKNDNNNNNNS